ncbi:MAG: hypothetical protein KF814_00095 [Nitrospiraceae bacterium]|nr:hypothetical protein [Nitrospiraceae bacterium]
MPATQEEGIGTEQFSDKAVRRELEQIFGALNQDGFPLNVSALTRAYEIWPGILAQNPQLQGRQRTEAHLVFLAVHSLTDAQGITPAITDAQFTRRVRAVAKTHLLLAKIGRKRLWKFVMEGMS